MSLRVVMDGSSDSVVARFVKPALMALCEAMDGYEVPLRFLSDGLFSYAMEPAVYCRVEVSEALFDSVEVDGQVDVCVDGEMLQRVLRRVRARDGLRLGVTEEDEFVIEVVTGDVRRPFYLAPCSGVEMADRLDVPYDVRVRLEPSALADAVRDVAALPSSSLPCLEVASDGERVVVRSVESSVKEIVEFQGKIVDGEGAEVAQEYSVDLLSPVVSVASASVASRAEVRFGEGLPLAAEVWLGAGGEVKVELIVVPMIEGSE